MTPRPGDVLRIGGAASVQFAGDRGFLFRVIQTSKSQTCDCCIWMDGYTLGTNGYAKERRTIYVQLKGLEYAELVTATVTY